MSPTDVTTSFAAPSRSMSEPSKSGCFVGSTRIVKIALAGALIIRVTATGSVRSVSTPGPPFFEHRNSMRMMMSVWQRFLLGPQQGPKVDEADCNNGEY